MTGRSCVRVEACACRRRWPAGGYRDLVKQATGETIRSIGKALGIDSSCVPEWAKRKRETGSLEPALMGGRKPRALSGETAAWLRERLQSGPFTTHGLTAELAERGVTRRFAVTAVDKPCSAPRDERRASLARANTRIG